MNQRERAKEEEVQLGEVMVMLELLIHWFLILMQIRQQFLVLPNAV